jgi:hypothetical protein
MEGYIVAQYLSNFSQEVEPVDALIDPVNKIRVSTPENLIDTDFEYGLQSTKWETLELINNIPSFYVSDSDTPLADIVGVNTRSGSNVITVTTESGHGLLEGTPIDVRGLSSRTAEGKFLIKSVNSATTFSYVANGVQTFNGNIGSIYTTITPGNFYSGSQMPYRTDVGILSNAGMPGRLTISTNSEHGHVVGTNVYLVNTFGTKKIQIDGAPSSTSPDGRPFVDPDDLIVKVFNPTLGLTETKEMRSTYYKKFVAADVSVANNTISWVNSELKSGDCLLYVPPSGDTVIGGLERFEIYYVVNPTNTTIQLSTTRSGSAINFTTAGSYNFGRAGLHLVYEITAMQRTTTQTRLFHRDSAFSGDNSGWDWSIYNWGLGRTQPSKMALIARNGGIVDSRITNRYYSTAVSASMVMPESTNTPGIYNFIEDFTRYEAAATFSPSVFTQNNNGIYFTDTAAFTSAVGPITVAASQFFFIPLVFDEERDSLYRENHGILSGQQINVYVTSGANILKSNSTTSFLNTEANSNLEDGSYIAEVISPNRFRITSNKIVQATGVYQITAEIPNEANNSFFYTDHGYTDNEIVTVTGAQLPATKTGLITLDAKLNTGNMRGAWTILNGFMDTYTDGLANHRDLVLNGFANSNIFLGNGVLPSATSGITSMFYDAVKMEELDTGTIRNGIMYQNKQEPTFVQDAGAGTILANKDFSFIGTKWIQDREVPHYSVLYSVEALNANKPKAFEASLRAIYPSTSASYRWSNRSHTISSDSDWRSTAQFAWSTRSSAINAVQFEVVFWNEKWNGFNTNSFTAPVATESTPRTITGNFNIGYVRFISTFMVNANTPMTNGAADTLITNLMTDFASKFQQPTLLSGDSKSVKVITKDRFYLEDTATALEVDLTGSGGETIFTQSNAQGVLDGAYQISSIPSESQFVLNIPFEAAQTSFTVDSTTVNADNFVRIPLGHSFVTGTRVNYLNVTNTSIPGLTNEGSYYVFVKDDEWIGLSESYEDAISGILIDISAGTGDHWLVVNSIDGRSRGLGTVAVVRGSRKLVGSGGSLFKRYFKAGDVITIKDDTATPGTLVDFVVDSIADDNTLQLDKEPNFSSATTRYFVNTKIYIRPDGYSVHRPFDGGVEMSAGSSPNSSIVRQTRKYFRYQSGKGIQTSLAINFNPPVQFETLFSNGLTATATTRYPHGLSANASIIISGSVDTVYNGTFTINEIIDDFTFTYTLPSTPTSTIPSGIIQYNLNGYTGAFTRGGMYDYQNGFFYEYDGIDLWCVRRSSTQQLSGKVSVFNNENLITGVNTNFLGQLAIGDMIVIRGQSHRVVKIRSNSELVVQPQYKGITATDVVITKTVDTKVKQSNWSKDRVDGTGPSGYNLNLNKIQMAYMDYSWYGAGKVRFGFKDTFGKVIYVHEFIHNNVLDEAYMRSGNLPARYEIESAASATYAPTLFHWGTSVIMDGRFDDDSAYLFTSTSDSLSYTNGQSLTSTASADSILTATRVPNTSLNDYRVRLQYPVADAPKFSVGTPLYTDNNQLSGRTVEYTQISGSSVFVFVYLSRGATPPVVFPRVTNGTVTYIGAPSSAVDTFNLGTDSIPLLTIRLAPSVDSGLSGDLGGREIINRMQLILNEVGLILTHDCDVSLVLNADLSNVDWQNVSSPSLSQLVKHKSGDKIVGGTNIFSFRASGGSVDSVGNRLSNSSNFDLGDLINLGNSILGGNKTFPNGPDTLSIVIKVVNTSGINATNKFIASGRVTWSESQA